MKLCEAPGDGHIYLETYVLLPNGTANIVDKSPMGEMRDTDSCVAEANQFNAGS